MLFGFPKYCFLYIKNDKIDQREIEICALILKLYLSHFYQIVSDIVFDKLMEHVDYEILLHTFFFLKKNLILALFSILFFKSFQFLLFF